MASRPDGVGEAAAHGFAADLFAAADQNKDGRLDRAEFDRCLAACEVARAAGIHVVPADLGTSEQVRGETASM